MIDLILNLLVFVIAASALVIFPVFRRVRQRELAETTQPVWHKGEPLVMVLIGVFCAGLYGLMFMELNARIDQTSLLVMAALLLAVPTSVGYVTLLALYHVLLWIRRR
ncbi:MAG: hypothetical protein K0M70_00735 [Arenimonas sp.]|uniref:hypothetical protein n=1 Tax=Arenimonas sp. TaxID=1872635 RepID=UPI0025B85A8B|nr:hypothetical protein [Arenimonas sp.]MBW8366374.1 hypothetical protein [Arenimonas sp.]